MNISSGEAEITADAPTGLRAEAKAGALWTTLLTVASRLQQTVLQLVLAWILAPEDFGLIALATTVLAFAWFLRHAGLGAVLIQRQKRFHLWVSPATAMVTITGSVATLLAVAAAWPAAELYGRAELAPVILVFSLSVLPEALRSVAQAKLRSDLRFRALANLQMVGLLVVLVLSIGLALAGAGVYALVIPRVAAGFLCLLLEWAVARPGVRWSRLRRIGRWRYLLGSSAWITAAGLLVQVLNQGDYAILGYFTDETTVGNYYFAFLLSTQAMMLVTVNIGGVLTPVLARMQDRPRDQEARFFEVCRLVALVGVPACFGLALVADPLLRIFFDPRWLPAIGFLQWLSVGMAFRLVGHNGAFLLQANGRWRRYFWLSARNTVSFLACCLAGQWLGGAMGLTLGVATFYAGFGFTQLAAATWTPGKRPAWREVARVYAAPLAACVPWFLTLHLADQALPWPPAVALPVLVIAGAAGYVVTLTVIAPTAWRTLLEQTPGGKRCIRRAVVPPAS